MNVTVLPWQTFVDEDAMVTVGITLFVTVMVIPVLVAFVDAKQVGNVPPAVCLATKTSLFETEDVNVEPFPTWVPFFNQV